MPNINKESVQKILSILNNHGVDKINIRSFGGERTNQKIY